MALKVHPRRLLPSADACLFCQLAQARRLHTSFGPLQQSRSPSDNQKPSAPRPARAERPHVRARDGELMPKPLSRPLGLPHPPRAGENSGRDTRSWRQRRDDYASYDKHMERRDAIVKDLYQKNYFRDIGNIGRIHKGKSMLAPTTPFRSGVARYFPNLQGRTLARGAAAADADTTPVLRGRVSVVSLLSSAWARDQCQTFVGGAHNTALAELLAGAGARDVAQAVEINVEENVLKYWLVRMFMGRLRRATAPDDWGRYFLVHRGLSDDIRDALGVWNGKVGYVYLLDGMCRVRWAGNGNAREDERRSLVNCVKRLVDEAKGVQRMRPTRQDARPTVSPPGAAAVPVPVVAGGGQSVAT